MYSSVANITARRRRIIRLLFCLMILCFMWVFFELQDGAAAIPVHRKESMTTGRRPDSPELPPVGTGGFYDNKRRAPSSPDPLHNR